MPATALTPVGASGTVRGVTGSDAAEAGPGPTMFRAVTVKSTEPTEASTRDYSAYHFFKTETKERPVDRKP